jgi:hypothetical protein
MSLCSSTYCEQESRSKISTKETSQSGDFDFKSSTKLSQNQFDFDVLDATKLIPEDILSLRMASRLVLDRNVDNFFAETEQVAYGLRNVVARIDFANLNKCPSNARPTLYPVTRTIFASETEMINASDVLVDALSLGVSILSRDFWHRRSCRRWLFKRYLLSPFR